MYDDSSEEQAADEGKWRLHGESLFGNVAVKKEKEDAPPLQNLGLHRNIAIGLKLKFTSVQKTSDSQ